MVVLMETLCVFYKARPDFVASTNAYSLSAKPVRITVELTNAIPNLTLMLPSN